MIAKLHTLHDGQAIKYDVFNLYLLLILLKAYNILAAQIEQTRQLGQRLEAKILDVRDVDVSIHYSQKLMTFKRLTLVQSWVFLA